MAAVGWVSFRASHFNRSLSIPQELGQPFAIGHLRLDAQQVSHKINDNKRDCDAQDAKRNKTTPLPCHSYRVTLSIACPLCLLCVG